MNRPFMKALVEDLKWNAPPVYLEDHGVNIPSEMLKNIKEGRRGEAFGAAYAADCEQSWGEAEGSEGEPEAEVQACPEGSWWYNFKERVSQSWEYVQSYREARTCETTMADWHGKSAALGLSQADQVMDVMARSPKLRGEMMLVIFFSSFRVLSVPI